MRNRNFPASISGSASFEAWGAGWWGWRKVSGWRWIGGVIDTTHRHARSLRLLRHREARCFELLPDNGHQALMGRPVPRHRPERHAHAGHGGAIGRMGVVTVPGRHEKANRPG